MPMSPRLLRPRQASGFDPRSISGLALWLDFADLSTLAQNSDGSTAVATDNDPIGYIADKSGNGRHFSQSTNNNRPLLGTLGGRRAAVFDGSNDAILGNAASLDIARNVGGFSAFVVKQNAVTNVQMTFLQISNGTASLARFFLGYSGTLSKSVGVRRADGDSLAFVLNSPSPSSALNIFYGQADYANGGANALRVLVNGSVVGSNTLAGSGNSANTNSLNVSVGAGAGGTGTFFNGTMGEVLAFPRVLAEAERQAVERYLSAKWGIVI